MSPAAIRNGLLISAAMWVVIIYAFVGCSTDSPYPVPPKQYQGPMATRINTTDNYLKACAAATTINEFGPAIACYLNGVVIVPNACTWPGHELYAALLCHEFAHVNGYPADHPRN